MDDYLCLTLLANAGESESAFKARLTAFWSHLLRAQPDVYEAVYAEAKAFERTDGVLSRAYMIAAGAAEEVAKGVADAGIGAVPLDPDDTYSKHEASSSEWFQIDH